MLYSWCAGNKLIYILAPFIRPPTFRINAKSNFRKFWSISRWKLTSRTRVGARCRMEVPTGWFRWYRLVVGWLIKQTERGWASLQGWISSRFPRPVFQTGRSVSKFSLPSIIRSSVMAWNIKLWYFDHQTETTWDIVMSRPTIGPRKRLI